MNILDVLIKGAQGMFRWVQMSLEALSRIKFRPDFENALGQLPTQLFGLYDIIYTQIDKTESYGRSAAIKTFKWLLCAQRLLSVAELLSAVGIGTNNLIDDSDEDDELEFERKPSAENDALRLCRNLVVLDVEGNTFRFAHPSVREFLLQKQGYTLHEQHVTAVERCLEFVMWMPSSTPKEPSDVQQEDYFMEYAVILWPVHYKYVEASDFPHVHEKILRFCTPEFKPLAILRPVGIRMPFLT